MFLKADASQHISFMLSVLTYEVKPTKSTQPPTKGPLLFKIIHTLFPLFFFPCPSKRLKLDAINAHLESDYIFFQ